MQQTWKTWSRRAIFGVTSLAVGWCAGPALAGIICYELAVTSWTQNAPPGGNCSTYSNCPDRILCLEGDIFAYAGTITFQNMDCLTYSGGTWDPIKKTCVGGTKITSQQSVDIFVQDCSGSCN